MGADENGLDNTSGGLCSTHSMKLKLFVHPGGTQLLKVKVNKGHLRSLGNHDKKSKLVIPVTSNRFNKKNPSPDCFY